MAVYKTNVEAQTKYAPMTGGEPFLKGVPKERLFIPKEGQYKIRLLPAWTPAGYFAKAVFTHWEVGMSRSSIICPNVFQENSCPFCQVFSLLKGEYEKNRVDIDSGVRPAKRFYSNIINLSQPELGVCVWSYGSTIYKILMGLQTSGEYGDITDPVSGTDLTLTVVGTGRQARPVLYPARQTTPLQNPNWLDNVFDLDQIFNKPNPADVSAAFASHPWKIYQPKGVTEVQQPPLVVPPAVVVSSSVQPATPQVTVAPPSSVVVNNDQRSQDLADLQARLKAKMHGG